MKYCLQILFFLLLFFQYSIADDKDKKDNPCGLTPSGADVCIAAFDYGLSGSTVNIKAYEDKWVPFDTKIFSTGKSSIDGEKLNDITLLIDGSWVPWGVDNSNKGCVLTACSEGILGGCYTDGVEVNIGESQANIPCCLTKGEGLYGLISINGEDPNKNPNLNPQHFAVFRSFPTEKENFLGKTVDKFTLSYVEVWNPDTRSYEKKNIPSGRLYFKILDNVYGDNRGNYSVTAQTGIISKEIGLVQGVMLFVEKTLKEASDKIWFNITHQINFKTLVKAILIIFILFNVFFFMFGLIEINVTELVVRLFKIAVIGILVSDATTGVVKDLFEGFVLTSQQLGNIIMNASMQAPDGKGTLIPLPDTSSIFSAYDGIFNMFVSSAFNVKVLCMLFTSKFYLIPMIYVCAYLMLKGLFKSLVQYLMSFSILGLLIVILPIFLVSILFKKTIFLFDNWLKQFIASSISLIIVTTAVGLLVSIAIVKWQELLYYPACWVKIWEPKITDDIILFTVKFWQIADFTAFDSSMTLTNFFYVFVCSMLFAVYVDSIPQLVDALAQVSRTPLSNFYKGMMGSIGSVASGFQGGVLSLPGISYLNERHVKLKEKFNGELEKRLPLAGVAKVLYSSPQVVGGTLSVLEGGDSDYRSVMKQDLKDLNKLTAELQKDFGTLISKISESVKSKIADTQVAKSFSDKLNKLKEAYKNNYITQEDLYNGLTSLQDKMTSYLRGERNEGEFNLDDNGVELQDFSLRRSNPNESIVTDQMIGADHKGVEEKDMQIQADHKAVVKQEIFKGLKEKLKEAKNNFDSSNALLSKKQDELMKSKEDLLAKRDAFDKKKSSFEEEVKRVGVDDPLGVMQDKAKDLEKEERKILDLDKGIKEKEQIIDQIKEKQASNTLEYQDSLNTVIEEMHKSSSDIKDVAEELVSRGSQFKEDMRSLQEQQNDLLSEKEGLILEKSDLEIYKSKVEKEVAKLEQDMYPLGVQQDKIDEIKEEYRQKEEELSSREELVNKKWQELEEKIEIYDKELDDHSQKVEVVEEENTGFKQILDFLTSEVEESTELFDADKKPSLEEIYEEGKRMAEEMQKIQDLEHGLKIAREEMQNKKVKF